MKPVDLLEATEKVGAAGARVGAAMVCCPAAGCAAAIVQQVQQGSRGPPLPCAHKKELFTAVQACTSACLPASLPASLKGFPVQTAPHLPPPACTYRPSAMASCLSSTAS